MKTKRIWRINVVGGFAYECRPNIWLHARSRRDYWFRADTPFVAFAELPEIAWISRADAANLLRASRAKLRAERRNA